MRTAGKATMNPQDSPEHWSTEVDPSLAETAQLLAATWSPATLARLQANPDAQATLRATHDDVAAPSPGLAPRPPVAPDLGFGRLIGAGGMGVVYRAVQQSLRREVAVKLPRSAHSAAAAEALLREARVAGALEHPNVVPVHVLGQGSGGEPLIVMKHVDGRPWSDILHGRKGAETKPLEWHLGVLMQVCNAAHFAHSRQIVHRDLKPDNVMIGDFGVVCLLDWGIAVAVGAAPDSELPRLEDAEGLAGTPVYMAPEIGRARPKRIGPWTDVYLLGAILHEILSGRPPHLAESFYLSLASAHLAAPPTLPDSVPRELQEICRRAMAREPEDRFASAEALRTAIESYQIHAASHRLTHEAEARLGWLRTHATPQSVGEQVPAMQVHRAATECRFAVAQALQIWPENPDARALGQAIAAMMFDFEIGRRDETMAAGLLAEIVEPTQAQRDALAALQRSLRAERSEVERLKHLDREVDVGVASRVRVAVFLAAGLIWVVLDLVGGILFAGGVGRVNHLSHLFTPAVSFVGYVSTAFALRRRLLRNRANRAIAFGLGVGLFALTITGLLEAHFDVPIAAATATDSVMFGLIAVATAGGTDPRAIWVGVVYLTAAALGVAVPSISRESHLMSVVVAVLVLARLWSTARAPAQDDRAD